MIKYPSGHQKNKLSTKVKTSSAHRGTGLEHDLNLSNKYYLDLNIALVNKRPTPIQVVDVYYPQRSKAQITKAFYTTPSTTDYNGVYKGKALDFEAKQTKSTTSFSFSLLHEHQIKHLQRVINHQGIAFFIIRFTSFDETYYVKAEDVLHLYKGKRRSIPYSWFKEHAYLIPYSLTPPIDYIRIIDILYFKGDKNGKQ